MILQTPVLIGEQPTISIKDKVAFFGSCFSTTIGEQFAYHGYNSLLNCFGTVYNSASILKQLQLVAGQVAIEDEIIEHNTEFYFLQGNTAYKHKSKTSLIELIEQRVQQIQAHLELTKFCFITLGTADVFSLQTTNEIVANCQKLPANLYSQRGLTVNEIQDHLQQIVQLLNQLCSTPLTILFTLSPVRYIKNGLQQNAVSKAKLLLAIHQLLQENEDSNHYYFPSYEIVLDELRDYRFYADDFVHLNELGKTYIWQKVQDNLLSDDEQFIRTKVAKIRKLESHKVVDKDKEQEHLTKVNNKRNELIAEYNFLNHLQDE